MLFHNWLKSVSAGQKFIIHIKVEKTTLYVLLFMKENASKRTNTLMRNTK